MDRRLKGALLLLVALVVAMVVPNIATRKVAGEASGGPVQGVPSVGDCLLEPTDTSMLATVVAHHFFLASPAVGSCTDMHYGEIVAVTPSGKALTTQLRLYGADRTCLVSADKYLGLPVTASAAGSVSIQLGPWAPITGGTTSIGPNARQRSIGQNWVACVVAGNGPSALKTGTGYHGSVRGAFAGGRIPDSFADCSSSINPGDSIGVACDQPHQAEIFAYGDQTSWTMTQNQLTASCRQLVVRLTRMSDPTDGGRLKIDGVAFSYDETGIAEVATPPFKTSGNEETECAVSVVGERKLTGTLFGLGDEPVPYAA